MNARLSKAVRYDAVQQRNKKYDGIFYFAAKTDKVYCRPSCASARPLRKDCLFFTTVDEAKAQGYHACKQCHPDRLKNGLSVEILGNIDAGALNDMGVHGLADSMHISERHLRRIVKARTGSSPLRINKTMRLSAAKHLITQTKQPITEIAFTADFSSLRQFNNVFRDAFKTSPREMRKTATSASTMKAVSRIVSPLKLSYEALLRVPSAFK